MHFLCGLDGSAGGRHAAYVAAHLANRLHADMILLRTVRQHDDAAGAELERFSKVIELSGGVRPTVRVESGHATAALLAAGRAMAADLLVVGGMRDGLADEVPCPVLVVLTAAALPVPSSSPWFTTARSRPERRLAGRFAACLRTKLTAIHVLSDPRAVAKPAGPLHRRAIDDSEAATDGADLEIAPLRCLPRPGATSPARSLDCRRPSWSLAPPARPGGTSAVREHKAASTVGSAFAPRSGGRDDRGRRWHDRTRSRGMTGPARSGVSTAYPETREPPMLVSCSSMPAPAQRPRIRATGRRASRLVHGPG
jgi:hypothetical protein